MKNILITLPLTEKQTQLLEKQAPDAAFAYVQPFAITPDLASRANIILGNVPPQILRFCTNLEWLQLSSSGADEYLEPGILPSNVKLTNATGAYGLAVSEHMLAMVFALLKKLPLYRDHQNEGKWQDEGKVKSVYNSTTLIVGLGDLGNEFARRMNMLGSHVIGIKRLQTERPDYIDELYTMDALDEVLPTADIVALCLPSTKATYHLFDKKRLYSMKQDSILINAGRGTSIDTDALAEVLECGYLGGAGLDVTDPEPLPEDHKLWKLKNALITPHTAGGFRLDETVDRIVRICASNLQAFMNHRPLRNEVDFETGYRKL